MKKSLLSLLVCAAVSCSVYAEQMPQNEHARSGINYNAIVVKLKPSKPLLKATSNASKLALTDPALTVSTLFYANNLRSTQTSEMAELNTRYGFDRYMRIAIPEDKTGDVAYINQIIDELEQNANVEIVYPESMPVSLDKYRQEAGKSKPLLKSTLKGTATSSELPDYRQLQDYIKSPVDKRQGYYMGGVNRDSVDQYPGNTGEGITIISMENNAWNTNHINLPPISLSKGNKRYGEDSEHDSASVGIMAATDMGAGIRGLSWKSTLGYAAWEANNLYNMIPLLKAGDVVQMGLQTYGGEITGSCYEDCYVPVEHDPSYYDIVKALTDKGVYVIEAAGNGDINLDSPAFNGEFDVNQRDSGAIIAGAFCANNGARAYFSTYGSRVTSSAWGCWDVVTTGYGDLHATKNAEYTDTFAGTSSANPIVAGVVASLSGIAKAHNITVTPYQMRKILQETGTPLAGANSAKIGTQPDMQQAVAKILALGEPGQEPAPTANAGADQTVTGTTDSARSYPLDASKSQNAVSWSWSISKGSGTFWLQEKQNGAWVNSVEGAHAYAVIPANTAGEVTYLLTTKNKNGETAQDSVTLYVDKAETAAEHATAPAYNASTVYGESCTQVSYKGEVWQNQWYVNPGQETPGTGGEWGAWRLAGSANNSCK